MTKYIFLFLISVSFIACKSTVSSSDIFEKGSVSEPSTTTEPSVSEPSVTSEPPSVSVVIDQFTNYDYISSIANDTLINTNVAKVTHTKNSIPMLGVLISYNNIQISSDDSIWSAKLFGKEDHQLNHYYLEVSNGKFEFEKANETNGAINDGVVSVRLNKNHPDASVDSSDYDSKTHPDLKDALIAIDNEIDFSNYDSDADGHITPNELVLTFIIAGYEDSYEGNHVTNGVWAHQYCTSSQYSPTLDGVTLMGCQNQGNYALFGEKHNMRAPSDATIGVIAHELAHSALGLPDLYNTNDETGGIGLFGIMGAGAWATKNGYEEPGNTPTHFTPWSKIFTGWVTPVEDLGSVSLAQTATDSYNIIKIPISANHYYLLENRNNSGYDQGLYSLAGVFDGGVAIWHINQNKLTYENFELNNVNGNTNDKGVDLIEAKDTGIDYNTNGGATALFYKPNMTAFGTKVTNISTIGSIMTLNIN
ncbi:MAG: M6 family metalloprotease domain-containing protein [Campylobacterota bacterium]|nr:M6 family metalloprotease domain-containing protein [Campylobacterota bacterium]